jgi:hypothetical protein
VVLRLLLAAVISVASYSFPAGKIVAADLTEFQAIEIEFMTALEDIDAGRLEQAILVLRKLLAVNPGLARVRLELARALFLSGQSGLAKGQFLIVLSANDIPTPVKRNVLGIVRQIGTQNGFTYSLSSSIMTPSSAGRSYDSDTVFLNTLGKPLPFKLQRVEPPKFALALNASMQQQWRLGATVAGASTSLYVRGSADILESPGQVHDRLDIDAASGIRLSWSRSVSAIEMTTGRIDESGQLKDFRIGIGANWESQSLTGLTFFANAAVSEIHNKLNAVGNDRIINSSMGFSKALRGNGDFGLSISFERNVSRRRDASYTDVLVRAYRKMEFSGGLALNASIFYDIYQQDQASPGFAEPRFETEFGADFILEKTDMFVLKRFNPFIKFGLSRRNSSEAAFSYNESRFEAGLKTAF